ncbi:exopolyphosphatase [Bacillus sp. FJAT-45037]|uniref:exopolyphosphatase n=1 Tax=Bacillus sp. FJAT-45037 TaxID=2011007 RepID=UPI000C24FDA3|nr:exopolyphosphatase [Bacillus sp. FJAT-45037]
MNKQRFAIIDIGSNSIRLVITELDSKGSYKELHNVKKVARLSSHINDKGELTEKGVNLLLEILVRFRDMMNFHQVGHIATVGTAALRQSTNQKEVITIVNDVLGIQIRVLSDYEEAYYGYLAVINSTSIENGFTIDIGGGSTEVTYFKNRELKHYHSFPFGAVTLQASFIQGKEATEKELKTMKDYIIKQFNEIAWLKSVPKEHVIGIGGSARNLALIHKNKVHYPLGGLHQYELTQAELHHVVKDLIGTPMEDRSSIEGLSKDREDIIIPAGVVISSFVDYVGSDRFILSRRGLRDGLLFEEMLRPMDTNKFPIVVEESFHQLSLDYGVDLDHVKDVTKLAMKLYSEFKHQAPDDLSKQDAMNLLRYSAKTLYIGEFINKESSSEHTFYLVAHMTIDGLSHKERLAVAFISSFKSKSQMMQLAKAYKDLLSKKELKQYEFLGSIMKLAYCLTRTKRYTVKKIGKGSQSEDSCTVPIYYQNDCSFEKVYANKHKKHLERVTQLSINLDFKPISD